MPGAIETQASDNPGVLRALPSHRRVLVVDDLPAIHDDYRKILCARGSATARLAIAESAVLGQYAAAPENAGFTVDSAYQGQEALHRVEAALAAGAPYALTFVDLRMPPGWDGVETIQRLWQADPALQVVICSAYSDYTQQELVARLGRGDQFLFLRKPFDAIEVLQLACALSEKWRLQLVERGAVEHLEKRVLERTAALQAANRALATEAAEHELAREALQRQQAELRVLFDLIPAMIWFKDTAGTILRVNRRAAQATGLEVEALEGRSAFEVYPQRAAEHHADDQEVIRSGQPRLGVLRHLRDRAGNDRWMQTDKVPYRDAGGNIIGLIAVAQDVTDRVLRERALRESEERMRATVDSALDCIVTMDALGRITEFNPAAERTFGFRRQEVLGHPLADTIVPAAQREAHRNGVQRVLDGDPSRLLQRRVEMVAVRADGREIPVELAVTRWGSGAGTIFTGFMRDITERRRGAQEVARASRSLRMLGECNEAVIHAQGEAALLDRVCRIVVEVGGYGLAGVGYLEKGEPLRIRNVTAFGDTEGVIQRLGERGCTFADGPAGRAVMRGEVVVVADLAATDWDFESRGALLQRGYRSAISLPLCKGGICFGTVGMCSTEVFSAGEDELRLLRSLADNLAFGISLQRATAERERAEHLRRGMERELADSLARQQSLSRRLVEVRELEQQKLSSELHDRIGQDLTALSINLGIIDQLAPPALGPRLSARLEDSRRLLERTIASVREVIAELRPAALDHYGLLAGLRGYGEQVQVRTGLGITVEGAEPVPRLDAPVEAAMFRIAQEALTNAVKHAHASGVQIRLDCVGGMAQLSVADDGSGFDVAAAERQWPRTSWGLQMMRERAEAVGARLGVASAVGAGTRVRVEVPIGRSLT